MDQDLVDRVAAKIEDLAGARPNFDLCKEEDAVKIKRFAVSKFGQLASKKLRV